MLAVLVETKPLAETVLASVVAGIGVTTIFSFAIWGAARFIELNRSERTLAATGAAAVGILALVATLGGVVLALVVMTSN